MKRKVIIALYALVLDIAFMTYLNLIDGDLLNRTYSSPAGVLHTAAREALDSNLTMGTVASFASSLAIFLGLYLNRHWGGSALGRSTVGLAEAMR